jgi:hypothetical protein
MTTSRNFTPEQPGLRVARLAYACVLTPILFGGSIAAEEPAKMPVLKWTVQDAPDFRYQFLDKVRTKTLLHATPETGTFNLHGYLKYYQGVLFACWDSQARDENTSGQHGVFRYSADGGESWSPLATLFPPLADNVPASETKQPNPFQTSQGFAEVDGRLYAVTCVDKALGHKVYRYNEVSRLRIGFLAREVQADGTLGAIFWLSDAASKPEPGYPAYPAGNPELVAKLNSYFKEAANLQQLLFAPRQHPDSDDEHRMTEPTQPWCLDDGTWVRLYRNQGTVHGKTRAEIETSRPRRHYASFSFDDGKTWTAPTLTDFPDTGARPQRTRALKRAHMRAAPGSSMGFLHSGPRHRTGHDKTRSTPTRRTAKSRRLVRFSVSKALRRICVARKHGPVPFLHDCAVLLQLLPPVLRTPPNPLYRAKRSQKNQGQQW